MKFIKELNKKGTLGDRQHTFEVIKDKHVNDKDKMTSHDQSFTSRRRCDGITLEPEKCTSLVASSRLTLASSGANTIVKDGLTKLEPIQRAKDCLTHIQPNAKVKDGLTLFPPKIAVKGQYYPSKNVICLTVKPRGCVIQKDQLELQVRVQCQGDKQPADKLTLGSGLGLGSGSGLAHQVSAVCSVERDINVEVLAPDLKGDSFQ